jgi:hypothetical protein
VPKPAAPKADGKTPGPKKDEAKTDPKSSAGEELDVHKTAERIAENAQKAGDRLKEKDPGEDTRKIQQEIVKDIDSLIKKAQQPPPPPMSSDMNPMPPMMPPPMGGAQQKSPMGGIGGGGQQSKSPMGGMGGSPQPKSGGGGAGGSESQQGRRPRRDRKPRGDGPIGMGDPVAKEGAGGMNPMPVRPEPKNGETGGKNDRPAGDGSGDRFGKASPKRKDEKLADLYKDVWGHLPDRLRQEMDLYYREKFMPRYSELLRQYYAALAEQKRAGTEDR